MNRRTPTPHRSLISSLAAHESWANTSDRAARTAPGRAAMMAKFEAEVDPEGVLPEAERRIRAEHKRKAYFQRLALKSAQARRHRAQAAALDAEVAQAEAELDGGAR